MMRIRGFVRNQQGSAVRWFAYAAAALVVTAAVGAHGLAWLVRADNQPRSAFLPLNGRLTASHSLTSLDMTPVGSTEPGAPDASGRMDNP